MPSETEDVTRPGAQSDDEIRELVKRLSRHHRSGGRVIERAAIMAEAGDSNAVLRWITAHGGEPEALGAVAPSRGLHGDRGAQDRGGADLRTALRFVLPPGAV
jgi:hypothetical protein